MTPHTADRVTPLLQQRIKTVFRRLPKALAGSEEDLHQLRVGGRRLRVALPILGVKPGGRRVRRSLRTLRAITRAGGIGRDLDVAVGLFEEELARAPLAPERRLLRRRLVAARARARARMAEALLDLEIARLRRDLRVLSRRGDGFFAASRRLRETRDRQGAEALAIIAALGERFDPVELHRLRRRVRRLRYAAELSSALKGQPAPAAAEFRALQDQLGALHDAYVLSGWFTRQAGASRARGQGPLGAEAASLAAVFLEASRGHHRAFLALPPAEAVSRGLELMGSSSGAALRAGAGGERGPETGTPA
ncbi:MAG TPA: CHAD domain-containing protein [Vicinamibacteria bacterium]|nr:CHAD domain-containing protein [Vicinamibacteria bacterium]